MVVYNAFYTYVMKYGHVLWPFEYFLVSFIIPPTYFHFSSIPHALVSGICTVYIISHVFCCEKIFILYIYCTCILVGDRISCIPAFDTGCLPIYVIADTINIYFYHCSHVHRVLSHKGSIIYETEHFLKWVHLFSLY